LLRSDIWYHQSNLPVLVINMISWYTSNSSPLTRIWYTGVILFVPRRSYRNMNPSRSSIFFIASSIWKIYSRAHSCAGTRPHKTDLEVLSCDVQTFYRDGHDLRHFNRLPCCYWNA
jgi:hypothetical protein